jgi:hypothetical protein
VPQLSQLVYRNNKGIEKPILNFKGFMVRTQIFMNLYLLLMFCLLISVEMIGWKCGN